MKKYVDVIVARPVMTTKIPIRRNLTGTYMETIDILRCLNAGAVVYENLPDGNKIMLNKDNYDTVNQVSIKKEKDVEKPTITPPADEIPTPKVDTTPATVTVGVPGTGVTFVDGNVLNTKEPSEDNTPKVAETETEGKPSESTDADKDSDKEENPTKQTQPRKNNKKKNNR